MRKSVDIRDEKTILKLNALKGAFNMSAAQIIDRAFDTLILSMDKKKEEDLIIHSFITQSKKG